MIYSMTAFGRSQDKGDWGNAIWELRSINHRYLDIVVRLPDALREIEPELRKILQQSFQRGKIECILRFQPGPSSGTDYTVNEHLLQQLVNITQRTLDAFPKAGMVNIPHLLSWSGVIYEDSQHINTVYSVLIKLFETAVQDLTSSRAREGENLNKIILERLEEIKKQVQRVKEVLPQVIPNQQEKIRTRLEEAQVQLDPARLEQEIVYYAVKIDVSEELDRLESHINEVKRALQQGNSVGRRLDFMMQELNREANTLSAKSTDANITHAAVEMKVLIEQIREQVQNIE